MPKRGAITDYFPLRKFARRSMTRGWRPGTYRRRRFRMGRRFNTRLSIARSRARRRTMGARRVMRVVSRSVNTLTPDIGGTIKMCTYNIMNAHRFVPAFSAYSAIFDEYKISKCYQKFRIEKSAALENDQNDIDVTHWSCYDPDAEGRTFSNVNDFRAHPSAKWSIVKPYQVKTTVLSPGI